VDLHARFPADVLFQVEMCLNVQSLIGTWGPSHPHLHIDYMDIIDLAIGDTYTFTYGTWTCMKYLRAGMSRTSRFIHLRLGFSCAVRA
jgi:hypothetical protein